MVCVSIFSVLCDTWKSRFDLYAIRHGKRDKVVVDFYLLITGKRMTDPVHDKLVMQYAYQTLGDEIQYLQSITKSSALTLKLDYLITFNY